MDRWMEDDGGGWRMEDLFPGVFSSHSSQPTAKHSQGTKSPRASSSFLLQRTLWNARMRTMVPSRSSLAGGLLLLLVVPASAFVAISGRSTCGPLVSETQHIINPAVRQSEPLHASSSSSSEANAAADASIDDDVDDDDDDDDDDTVIHIKSKAMERLRELKSKQEDPSAPMILRMGVRSGGCSGMSYVMDFTTEDDVNEDDEIDEYPEDGIKCVVDAKSLLFLYGLELDYSDELIGGGFKFFNPNAEEECGCGSSFGV